MHPGFLKQNRMFRLNEGTGLRMEKIHHHVLHFVEFMETGQCVEWSE